MRDRGIMGWTRWECVRRGAPGSEGVRVTTGSVIVLNGPSSAGTTALATSLQRRFAADGECWFVYALDDYFAKVPFDWVTSGNHVGAHAEEGVVLEIVDGVFRMRM